MSRCPECAVANQLQCVLDAGHDDECRFAEWPYLPSHASGAAPQPQKWNETAVAILLKGKSNAEIAETLNDNMVIQIAAVLAAPATGKREQTVEEYKKSLDVPELEDFAKGVLIEAQHQRQRWGDEHDEAKEPEEWFWTIGYLAGKGLRAQRDKDWEKFKHHLITGAALLANWHTRAKRAALAAADEEGRMARLSPADEKWMEVMRSVPYNHSQCLALIEKLLAAAPPPREREVGKS